MNFSGSGSFAVCIREKFGQATIFLALCLVQSNDPLASTIKDLDPSTLLDQLQRGLRHQCASICPDLNVIIAIRMLLISIGAQISIAEIHLSKQHELNLPKMIYALLGGYKPESLHAEINLPVFLGVLSSTRAFKDCFLDPQYISQQAQKWGVSLWLSLTVSSNLSFIWTSTHDQSDFPG